MGDGNPNAFVFPPFRLDPGRRLLTREGQPIFLTPKEFDTLLALVEAGGRVVEKEALIARVWADTFVADGSLTRNIYVLRKALGEDVIETLPRRGYRLSLPVTMADADALQPPIPDPGAAPVQPTASDATPVGSNRKWAAIVATAVVALFGLIASYRFWVTRPVTAALPAGKPAPVRSVLIQKQGGLNPLDEGFKHYGDDWDYQHATSSPEHNGIDRWKVMTKAQSNYYHPLSEAEKSFALQSDWVLSCTCAVEQGGVYANLDFGADSSSPRYDIALLQEGNKYFVALTSQISPRFEWASRIEFPGVADVDHPHTYELRYDHVTRTASLWIDGQQKATGYRGHLQFRENVGLMFGAATYLDANVSSGVFREVRFEAK